MVLLIGSFVSCNNTNQEELSSSNLDSYVQENQAKIVGNTNQSQFKMALENLQLLQELQAKANSENATTQDENVSRSVSAGAAGAAVAVFEAKTIPDRIKLGLKVIEAIVQGSTELANKKQAYLDLFAMRITVSLLDMVNPLSDTKTSYANLNKVLQDVMNAPEQSGDDIANIHIKQKLANRLQQYRLYKFNQTKESTIAVNRKLDYIILQATGVRLDALATVDGVKSTIAQVNLAAQMAMNNEMPKDFVVPKSKPFSFDLISKEQKKAGIDMGKEMITLLKEMSESFISMAKSGVSFVTGITNGKIDFDFSSIKVRIDVLKEITNAIVLGVGELSHKVQAAHTKLGFAATQALISAANPFSLKTEVEAALQELKSAIKFAKDAKELQADDTSSVNHKEAFAKKLREYRMYPLRDFAYKPQAEIDKFNALLLKATGVRLDPTQTVQQVEDIHATIKAEIERIKAIPDIPPMERIANFWQKDNLRKTIDKAFFTDKSKLSDERAKAMKNAIWNSRIVYFDGRATAGKVETVKNQLLAFIQEAD